MQRGLQGPVQDLTVVILVKLPGGGMLPRPTWPGEGNTGANEVNVEPRRGEDKLSRACGGALLSCGVLLLLAGGGAGSLQTGEFKRSVRGWQEAA